ncbi:Acetyl-coenzyme A transporter 1 [Folsomia candida]|uniref:Acetyl-coenzyme A transporter 1 n=1 Tax=Folsomia candida TaxID=158441 RepID=A0A226EX69_FOLCA|nr:Acetyl-coenzyme A transporter 1 [Folsomia candida]
MVFCINNKVNEKIKSNLEPGTEQGILKRILFEWRNISILLFLYTLQGVPNGLAGSIPLLLQARGTNYSDQAIFSLVSWPFNLKLLWAPLVDAIYWKRMGRRKSWLVPVQYLIGVTLLFLSFHVDSLIDSLEIWVLTALMFFLNLLIATQDIVVDGWALNLLKRENVGLATTCNAVGLQIGRFIGYGLFINLASPDFSNKYLRTVPKSDVGVVTLSGFMFAWSIIYFVCTTLTFFCKKEKDADPEIENAEVDEDKRNITITSYLRLWRIIKLPAVQNCLIFCLTGNVVGLSSFIHDLKQVEAGLSKEVLAQLSVPLAPLGLLITVLMTKWTSGVRPMSLFRNTYGLTLLSTVIFAAMVPVTGFLNNHGTFPWWYFPSLLGIDIFATICFTCTGVAQVAFITKISDPAYGATYATLFNTGINVGAIGSVAVSLWLVDPLTVKSGSSDGLCSTVFDGYYVETIACVLIGVSWFYFWGNNAITELQAKPESAWKLGTVRDECQPV